MTAVPLNERAHDKEAQSEPALLGILSPGAAKLFEECRILRIPRPRTLVFDPECDAGRRNAATDTDHTTWRRELAGVRQQVDEDLGQPLLVTADYRMALRQSHIENLASLFDQGIDQVPRCLDYRVQPDIVAADAQLSRLDSHALEQVVDEPRKSLHAAFQRRYELTLHRRRHAADAVP